MFLWALSFIVNIITFLLIYFKSGLHGNNVALRYTVKAGVLWYGAGKNLYTLPFLGLCANIINFLLFKKLSYNQNFLLYAAVITSLLMQVILFVSVVFLAILN